MIKILIKLYCRLNNDPKPSAEFLYNIYTEDSLPVLDFRGYPLALGFDQSTTLTGLTIGTPQGYVICSLAFIRDKKDANSSTYKNVLKKVVKEKIIANNNIKIIGYENIFSKGFYRADKELSAMKKMFPEIKDELNSKIPMIDIPQQSWKSTFLIEGYKQQTKENVEYAVHYRFPNFFAEQDVYDSIGIYYHAIQHCYQPAVVKQTSTGEKIVITKRITKAMKMEKRHVLSIRVVNTESVSHIQFTAEEESKIKSNGKSYFKYNDKLWIDDNCRRLTSGSNRVWIGEIPNANSSKFIDAIWWRFNINPEQVKHLYVICYRLRKTKNAYIDDTL